MLTLTFIRRDFVHGAYRLHTVTMLSAETAWTLLGSLHGVIRPRLWRGKQLIATRGLQ